MTIAQKREQNNSSRYFLCKQSQKIYNTGCLTFEYSLLHLNMHHLPLSLNYRFLYDHYNDYEKRILIETLRIYCNEHISAASRNLKVQFESCKLKLAEKFQNKINCVEESHSD